jgi:hypothetical protein
VKIPKYHAEIHWAAERGAAPGTRLVHPVYFPEDGIEGDMWTFVVTVAEPPAGPNNANLAVVHFLMAHAPHHHLTPGRVIPFAEGNTPIGRVTIGAAAGFIEQDP